MKRDLSNPNLLDEFEREQPVPGEALTKAPKSLPSERPSRFSNPEEVLDRLFENIVKPENATKLLALLDAGVPLDVLVAQVVQNAFGEGTVNANMYFIMLPPLIVIFSRMADAAGVEWRLSTDRPKSNDELFHIVGRRRISSNAVAKAMDSGSKSAKELTKMPEKGGLMARPESIM